MTGIHKNAPEIEPAPVKDHEAFLNELKEEARHVDFDDRQTFEIGLLKKAQTITDITERNAVYEVLVSLQSIWEEHRPQKNLREKFREAFEKKQFKEAETHFKTLAKQGLDHSGNFQTGGGELIPVSTGMGPLLLQFNRRAITLYFANLTEMKKIPMPASLNMLDLLIPGIYYHPTATADEKTPDREQKAWILAEGETGEKRLITLNLEILTSEAPTPSTLVHLGFPLEAPQNGATSISVFRDTCLLITTHNIYFKRGETAWQKWYHSDGKITAVAPTGDEFWIGHADGSVFILRDLHRVGVRSALKGFSSEILGIEGSKRFVLAWSKHRLIVADHAGTPVSEPLETRGHILRATIVDETLLLMLMAGGTLVARDLDEKNIRWQINLDNRYHHLLAAGGKVYCHRRDGETQLFETPPFHLMEQDLSSKGIVVESSSTEAEPQAPIKYISGFTGRKQLLEEIKEKSNTHFILYGEPRIGKTSLLNVLRDVLAEQARCCLFDMTQLYSESDSYRDFESRFIDSCLEQHYIKLPDNAPKDGYRTLSAIADKIRGSRSACVFCLDNFAPPSHFSNAGRAQFDTLLRSMLMRPRVRFIFTANRRRQETTRAYLAEFKSPVLYRCIPLLSELDVKHALRKKVSPRKDIVDKIFKYTGRFPHLLHFYDQWKPGGQSLEELSTRIGRTYSNEIFKYSGDLDSNASLLIATCLYEKLVSEKNSFSTFYEKFPFLRNCVSTGQLKEAVKAIDGYGGGYSAKVDGDTFTISIMDNAQLFHEAAKHIPWKQDFLTLYRFTSSPTHENAAHAAQTFSQVTQGGLDNDAVLLKKVRKFQSKFYVGKLSAKGQQSLKIPLNTFIVSPLKSWQKRTHLEAFNDLNIEFQEYNRKIGESAGTSAAPVFYTLLFEFHGVSREILEKDLTGVDRVSIIDAGMIKDIILAEKPQETASEFIFKQLSIRERSPYTSSGAVPDKLFFGRQMEMALIRGLPENIGIFGTRTIGKTSMLRKLHKTVKAQPRWKVYDMDCSRMEDATSMLKNLAEKMEVPFEKISSLDRFRQYVTSDAQVNGVRYLFLFDEVDRLVEYDMENDERILNTFNRLYTETLNNNETAARFILFGFQKMFEQMKNPGSRLYNFMVFLPLKPLDWESAMSLVTRPIENIHVHWADKKDAEYLAEGCSRHPRLLQTACHALLAGLDNKQGNRDIIERADVDRAFASDQFRETCMRFYRDKDEKRNGENSRRGKNWKFLSRHRSTGLQFLGDLHRITILAAIRLLFEEGKLSFTITALKEELKSYKITASPNVMRNVLDHLCLSGVFRLKNESILFSSKATTREEAENIKIEGFNPGGLTTDHPEMFSGDEANFPRYVYKFGVQIFPKLLVGHFGGIEPCKEECEKLVRKGEWKEWLKRY